ncbi:hypothetical protein GO011_07000 [Mycobacterium sp. 20091114027_K0903767]|nr:hypothetical protein [Mycobacterium sp. 20091114027_K0903767]
MTTTTMRVLTPDDDVRHFVGDLRHERPISVVYRQPRGILLTRKGDNPQAIELDAEETATLTAFLAH